mgnify:CR=1 FL=1
MDIERAFYLIKCVALNHTNRYAVAYCDAAQQSYDDYGEEGLKTQILYILNNCGSWRGAKARSVKIELRGMC